MSVNENAGNKEARQESAEAVVEPQEKNEVTAESVSAETQSESGRETSEPEEEQNADAVRVTDKRRFASDGELVIEVEENDAPETSKEEQEGIEQLQARVKEAEHKRAEAERQVQEYAERFRHAQIQLRTENEELRARWQRNFAQKLEAGRGDIVASLLDVLDNLKRAVAVAESSEGGGTEFESLLEGVRATAEMFETRMRNLGLTQVPSEGEEFNPEIHEAVEIVPVAAEDDHRVMEELQPGYKFGDRLLRPARVRVGRASE